MEAELEGKTRLRAWWRQLRIHQWSKNLLLFVPMLAAHALETPDLWLRTLAGALMLSLVASATYIFNDWLDLRGDQLVPGKRDRPLASGQLHPQAVSFAGWILFLAGLSGALLLDPLFCLLLWGYAVTSIVYSTFLKRILLLDVLVLSGMYLWRLGMGAQLAEVPLSPWFLGFAQFFFLSLALAKRYSELVLEAREGVANHIRRPYRNNDLPVIMAFGTGSALVAVLILALYISSDQSQVLYTSPGLLWLLCPVMLYWLARIWFKTHRGELLTDPVLFALRDRASHAVLLLLVVIGLLASLVN
ncbi:MAG: UbiA family prenyltransferase [Puniceicoccaceae bacterium]